MVMDISDFSYKDFASTLSKVRIMSLKYKYTCCIPGCNEITLKHSHIVPQCVLKKYICNFEKLCFDENCSAPLNMLFVHLLPKGEHSYLMLGYDKRHVSRRLMMLLEKWKKVLVHDTDLRTLYDILCHCSNNWCISPDCDERLLSALKSRYSEDRMNVNL